MNTSDERLLLIHQGRYKENKKCLTALHNHCSLHSMALITRFDHLPDLVLIELFSYLSSIDVLWAFINLNNRLQRIIDERGFFRHINLSVACRSKFQALLPLLRLNQIQSLIIDIEASILQLSHWPYLPRLITLRLYGLRDFEDATTFILRHSQSLQYLTLTTNENFMSPGFAGYMGFPKGRLSTLLETVLPQLNALRSLDLGEHTGVGLPTWQITTVPCSLHYLRVPIQEIEQLCRLMSVETLSTTLEQFHVTMRSLQGGRNNLPSELVLHKMIHLHTFIFVQSMFSVNKIEWSTIEFLTASNVMPVLRQVNLVMFITAHDLYSINRSALFTDDRRIDVQFALIMDKITSDHPSRHHMLHASRFNPREVVRATCVVSSLNAAYRELKNINCYFDEIPVSYHVWYTLPWVFEPFFELIEPEVYITKVETSATHSWNSSIIYPSRLRTLSISQNHSLPSIVSLPHVIELDRITTVHLLFHDWPIGLNLRSLRHVTLTNNLVELKDFSSFPPSIRSIQIMLRPYLPNFVSINWSVLRSLSALPILTSLHIVLHAMDTSLDDTSCQIIAEIVPMLVHFGICFRRDSGLWPPDGVHPDDEMESRWQTFLLDNPMLAHLVTADDDDDDDDLPLLELLFDKYRTSIEEIRRRILHLPMDKEPLIVVEEEGCGLTVWM